MAPTSRGLQSQIGMKTTVLHALLSARAFTILFFHAHLLIEILRVEFLKISPTSTVAVLYTSSSLSESV
jgi:hypothetical protein